MDNFESKLGNYGLDEQTAEQIKHSKQINYSFKDLSWRIMVNKSFYLVSSRNWRGLSLLRKSTMCTHNFQMTPNWQARGKEKEGNELILSMAKLPCRGTLRGWKNGLPEVSWWNSHRLILNLADLNLGRQKFPCNITSWGLTGWAAALLRKTWHQRPEGSWAVTGAQTGGWDEWLSTFSHRTLGCI